LVQSVVLVYSPFLFIQENFRDIARQSIADDSQVCYVVPDMIKTLAHRLFSFYVVRIYNRPDLAPQEMHLHDVPQDLSTRPCGLWADAVLQKRGVSVLKPLPQFSHCRDVPLEPSGARTGSELLDCRS
jgi:hypothetical protein